MCKPATTSALVQGPSLKGFSTSRLLAVPRAHGAPPRAAAGPSSSVQTAVREANNVVPAPTEGLGRRQQLELEARALMEQDSRWAQGALPANMHRAASPKHFKELITGARPDQLVIVEYMASHCNGCRSLSPKLQQIAKNNDDCVFVVVNTDAPELRDLAMHLGVTKLPFFQLWRESDIRASFTANVTTVSVLRAEIAAHKHCYDPGCDL